MSEDILKKVGALIKEARIKANITQDELAESLGTSQQYLSKIERGKVNLTLLQLRDLVELIGAYLVITIRDPCLEDYFK